MQTLYLAFCSYDNIALSNSFKIWKFLGDDNFIRSPQWRNSGNDLLQLYLGHFQNSHIKIICMTNCPKFPKTVWCNKIKKTNFLYAIIYHHLMQWFFPFMLSYCHIEASIYPNWPLLALKYTFQKLCIFPVFLLCMFH